MSEPKLDPLTATGRYRLHISKNGRPAPPVNPGSPTPEERHWLTQSQHMNPRHAAITRGLFNWSSYKTWADKMKTGWDQDKDK
jgi:hypothetical protein